MVNGNPVSELRVLVPINVKDSAFRESVLRFEAGDFVSCRASDPGFLSQFHGEFVVQVLFSDGRVISFLSEAIEYKP